MSDADPADRIRHLEAEAARLRRLLDGRDGPSGLRDQLRTMLGLMRAILRRSMDGKATVEDFAAHVEGRFDALLRVHTALLASPDGRADLASLVSDELLAQTVREGDQASLEGPRLRIRAHQAELLGLALHELTVNALKFGALTAPSGHIAVSWAVLPPLRLSLTWAETGRRLAEPRPAFRGFGTEAIEAMLPQRLQAESRLDFLAQGVRCRIAFPLDQAQA